MFFFVAGNYSHITTFNIKSSRGVESSRPYDSIGLKFGAGISLGGRN